MSKPDDALVLRPAGLCALATEDLASTLRSKLTQALQRPQAQLLWWGGDLAGLMPALLGALPRVPDARWQVADTDPCHLRRCAELLAPEAVHTLRLLAPTGLRQDSRALHASLQRAPLRDLDQYLAMQEGLLQQAQMAPVVANESLDMLVLDFALNRHGLDGAQAATAVLSEALRCLKRGGQLLCSALVADEPVNGRHAVRGLAGTAKLWLPEEAACWAAFEAAGFHGITLHAGCLDPLDRIEGADVRMLLVQAFKGKAGPCVELGQAVVYRGPWREVRDDDGHAYPRGARVAVCAKTYGLLHAAPYAGQFLGLRAMQEPTPTQALPFDCNTPALRHPAVTKGFRPFAGAVAASSACDPGGGCC